MNLFWAACVLVVSGATADVDTMLARALQQFNSHQYDAAIATLTAALEYNENRAETHFYLGKFKHYLCYDSVPFSACSRSYSDEILYHLELATELDPKLGDAFYFIGAEYGARALSELQSNNTAGFVEQLRSGRDAGGYPDWLIECARNTLRSCPEDAILFVGGDPEAHPIFYVQFVEGYRKDVSVLPVALLERPWFVRQITEADAGGPRDVPSSWNSLQVNAMRPYKWQANTIRCRLKPDVAAQWGLVDPIVEWTVEPDLGRGAPPTLLSASHALIADILVTNAWHRPVLRSLGSPLGLWEGLAANEQQLGFAVQLLPHSADSRMNAQASAKLLLDPESYRRLRSYTGHPMPRAHGLLENYYVSLISLAYVSVSEGDVDAAQDVLGKMSTLIPESVIPVPERLVPMLTSLSKQVADLAE